MMVVYIALGVMFAWLVVMSFFLFRSMKHYKNLTTRTGGKNIDSILDTMIEQNDSHGRNIDELKNAIQTAQKESESYHQKIGFVRFNPFDRVAGDQSFVIAILDKNDNGLVKTFLYTREGVRIYVKEVKGGDAVDFELSEEEKMAIKKAK